MAWPWKISLSLLLLLHSKTVGSNSYPWCSLCYEHDKHLKLVKTLFKFMLTIHTFVTLERGKTHLALSKYDLDPFWHDSDVQSKSSDQKWKINVRIGLIIFSLICSKRSKTCTYLENTRSSVPLYFYFDSIHVYFSDFTRTGIRQLHSVTYSGWILSTIPTRLPAPYLTVYKEKKIMKPFTNFVVLDEDNRWNRRTNTCFMYGERVLLKTIEYQQITQNKQNILGIQATYFQLLQ